MPLLLLGAIVVGLAGYYLYLNNKELFGKKDEAGESEDGPSNVIYLPTDRERKKSKDAKDTEGQ